MSDKNNPQFRSVGAQKVAEPDRPGLRVTFLILALIVVLALVALFMGTGKEEVAGGKAAPTAPAKGANQVGQLPAPMPATTAKVVPREAPTATYTVARGDFIVKIADGKGISYEELLLANRATLIESYARKCKNLSDKYKEGRRPSGRRRKGHFCNSRIPDAWGNTLVPGEKLIIPAKVEIAAPTAAQAKVVDAVMNMKGDSVAIVIDDTGSMMDDRETVARWYVSIAKQLGKKVVGVYLFGNGEVRKLDPSGEIRLGQIGGDFENTYGALLSAKRDASPDSLILISDEPGDDWPASDDELRHLPEAVAHCLSDDRATYWCSDTLSRLANTTGGTFVRGI